MAVSENLRIWDFQYLSISESQNLRILIFYYLRIWASEHLRIWDSENLRDLRDFKCPGPPGLKMLFQDLVINFLGLFWCTLHLLWAVGFKTSFSTTLIGQFKNKFQTISWNVAGIFNLVVGAALDRWIQKIYQKALPKNCAKKSVGWSQKVSRLYKTRLGFKKSCFPTILF